jgi:hypothetical protein
MRWLIVARGGDHAPLFVTIVSSVVRCCCGVGCAVCWIVIGVWAFFFLGVLALLFMTGKQGNIGHFKNPRDHKTKALTLFGTWLIYLVLTILYSLNLAHRLKYPFPPEEDDRAPNQKFSAIGPTTKFIQAPD